MACSLADASVVRDSTPTEALALRSTQGLELVETASEHATKLYPAGLELVWKPSSRKLLLKIRDLAHKLTPVQFCYKKFQINFRGIIRLLAPIAFSLLL